MKGQCQPLDSASPWDRAAPRGGIRTSDPASWPKAAARERAPLLAEHLDDHPFPALSIPLAVEHALPGPEIELPAGDGHDHLVPDCEAAQVRGGIVLPGLAVARPPAGPPRRRRSA